MDKYDVTVLRVAYGSNDGASLYALPEFISTMTTETTDYLPDAIKIGVPFGIAAVVVIIAAVVISVKAKSKKSKKNDE